jgi:hypothetical protein
MDEEIVKQILDELFSSFEDSETRSAALLLFLKDQGIATEEKLAPFFEQAGNTSEVRWRAARVRMGALLASALKPPEPAAEKRLLQLKKRMWNRPQTLTPTKRRGRLQNPNLRVPKTRQEGPLPPKMRLKTRRVTARNGQGAPIPASPRSRVCCKVWPVCPELVPSAGWDAIRVTGKRKDVHEANIVGGLVPGGGIEPPRTEARRILSPLRLPVPPSRLGKPILAYGSQ